ncbi:MAG: dTDP-4-dehydrorhamnose 3,5-epimerase family protein [Propionivibrio sp.]|uniref:polysaccharide biosynthesis C-terminal domain-containing protein n=1 Tax=Propionivibrio sp. TaxID=2212460 RepID=UPI001A5F7CD6|nr:cupin domain-containing protein [Propionivibrio sp.]MBL8413482.1 dTDP-4-dehydrorhamnose 3,5-epimerase family protein [Propionivibrio sp.]
MQDTQILPGVTRRKLLKREDTRGWLVKLLMREHINGPLDFGEIYITAAHAGQVKGNHFHERASEWFSVIQGRALMSVRVMASGESALVELSADAPEIIKVAPGVAHAFKNNGSGMMLLLAYADDPYNAQAPDEQRVVLLESDDATP